MKSEGLGQKIRSAYLWTSALQLTKNFVGFGISILLARFLEPKDYGLVGMVTVLIGIVSVVQDWGMGQAVIYFEEAQEQWPTFFTVTTATGVCLTALTFFAAPVAAAFYQEPRLIPIMRILSVTLLLGGLRAVSQGLLAKRFQFRSLTLVEAGCTLGAGIVAVLFAWRGFGAWSLVINILLQASLLTVFFCWMVRPRFSWHIDRPALRKVLRWALPLTGSSLLWQFYENSDYLVVGKLLGASPLGQYTVAFRLATVANDKISSVINRVSFPSFAAMQDDLKSVIEHWLSVTRKLGLLNFPLLVALAMNAEDFISVVLGAKWLPAAALVKFLCVVGALKSLTAVVINLACARGRTDIGFQFALLNAIILPASFVAGCKLGSLRGVGIAWSLVFPLTCGLLIWKVGRLVGVSVRHYCSALAPPALLAMVCFAGMLPVSWILPGGLLRLCVRSAVGLVCFAAALWFQPGMREMVRQLLGVAAPAAEVRG
ncbi:MAG TPA: lipopolysaccharide biosynthesis protein [Terriglobales bacterium]|nr:lipopolysaccharide biosynthesis protein [Terriglobales bacterium]